MEQTLADRSTIASRELVTSFIGLMSLYQVMLIRMQQTTQPEEAVLVLKESVEFASKKVTTKETVRIFPTDTSLRFDNKTC